MNLTKGETYQVVKKMYGSVQIVGGIYIDTVKALFGKRHRFLFNVNVIDHDYDPPYQYTKKVVLKVKESELLSPNKE